MGLFKIVLDIKTIKYFFCLIFILLFFISLYSRYLNKIPLEYNDEYYWIANSYFFELFIKGDFKNQLWESQWAIDQPKLAKYYYGLILYPIYIKEKKTKKDSNYTYRKFLINHYFYQIEGKEYSDYKNKIPNFIDWGPDKSGSSDFLLKKYGINFTKISELILYTRKFNIVILSINIIIVYFIALIVFDKFTAIISIILFGLNKLNVVSSIQAHSEVLFSLLFNLGLLLLIFVFKRNKENKIHRNQNFNFNKKSVFVFILIASLCTQTKLNGVILLFIFILLTLIKSIDFLKNRQFYKIYKLLIFIFISFVMFFVFFVIIDPFVYRRPINNSIALFNYRFKVANMQTKEYPLSHIPDINLRIKLIYKRFFSLNNEDNLSKLILYPDNNFPYGPIFFLLFIAGVVRMIFDLIIIRNLLSVKLILLISFILTQFSMFFYLILNWDRYYIPLVIFFSLFEAYGLKTLTGLVINRRFSEEIIQ